VCIIGKELAFAAVFVAFREKERKFENLKTGNRYARIGRPNQDQKKIQ